MYNIDPFEVAFNHCAQNGQPSNGLHSFLPQPKESIKTLVNSRHNELTFSIKNKRSEIIDDKGVRVLIECEVF